MSQPTVISEVPISMAQLKIEIDAIKKRDKELSFRTGRTEEYLNHFVNKGDEKLVDSLRKLDISRLKPDHAVKIADLKPTSVEDLKSVLHGFTTTFTKDHLQQIVDEVAKFV